MSETVLFYSPIRPANAGQASGLSRVASHYRDALRLAGFQVEAPDLPITYEGAGDPARQTLLRDRAAKAAGLLLDDLRARNVRPAAWLSYHCYYKSPDIVGPFVSRATGCAYLVAEGSFAAKRANGPWEEHHQAASRALATADVLLASTPRDREGLERVPGRQGVVVDFPPFIDCAPFATVEHSGVSGPVRILAAGSMTDPRKIQSFGRLLDAMEELSPGSMSLRLAGDGAHKAQIERRVEDLRSRGIQIEVLGELLPAKMPEFFALGDVFAWPGVGEAYGLTYLEAQAAGLPVVAENWAGVSACVRDGISGFLTDPHDEDAFHIALSKLIEIASLRQELGRSARQWVLAERSLSRASHRLRSIIDGVRK